MFRKEMRILEVLLLVNVEFQRPVKGFQVLGRSVRWDRKGHMWNHMEIGVWEMRE